MAIENFVLSRKLITKEKRDDLLLTKQNGTTMKTKLTHDRLNAVMAPGENMKKNTTSSPAEIPRIGKSRWSRIAPHSPVSKEKFRQLSKIGLAPQPERMGIRCTFYDNAELHRWLADPINYRAGE